MIHLHIEGMGGKHIRLRATGQEFLPCPALMAWPREQGGFEKCLKSLFTLFLLRQIFPAIDSNCPHFLQKLETGPPVNTAYKPKWVVRTEDVLLTPMI
jgi:hypothetical protein